MRGTAPFLPVLAPSSTRAQTDAMKHRPLSLSERIEIQEGLMAEETQAAVAARLARPASTISTEMRRSYKERKKQRLSVVATQGKIPDTVLVDERPAEVETRLTAGHYKGDLIVGAGNRSAVGVLSLNPAIESADGGRCPSDR